uniref:dual-specificity kinase n=1 Tax=Ornithorhynchus anatinus TaxID=9258 RepID=A0A6I8N9J5_ORNAN
MAGERAALRGAGPGPGAWSPAASSSASSSSSSSSSSYRALRSAVSSLARVDDFHRAEKIGAGFFSEVYKVQHRQSGQILVLKMNKLPSNRGNMLREVQLMNQLRHPNILRLMGVCVHQGQLHALTEYMNGGTLEQLLGSPEPLAWPVRLRLALDIARGLRYLHATGVFHRDLTSKNCLVRREEQGLTAVVGDFGLAEKIPVYREGVQMEPLAVVGSPYWMAPEVLRGELYDEKADVFAFGIILGELIARVPADPDYLPRTEDFGLDVAAFQALVGEDCPPPFLLLAIHCCSMEPKARAPFAEIAQRLEQILEQHPGPPGRPQLSPQLTPRTDPATASAQWLLPPPPPPAPGLRLSRSRSDLLPPPPSPAPPARGRRDTLPRVNPFSRREDLRGGKIKLLDTPSKSVVSLTLDPPPLPASCPPPVASGPPGPLPWALLQPEASSRRCCSLPTSPKLPQRPEPAQTPPGPPAEPDDQPGGPEPPPGPDSPRPPPALSRPGLSPTPTVGSFISTCTSSASRPRPPSEPEPPRGPLPNSKVPAAVVNSPAAGWGGQPWGRARHSLPRALALEQTELPPPPPPPPGAVPPREPEEGLLCPSCCLSPFSFGFLSVCPRPAPAVARYHNLNCEAGGLLCHRRHHSKPPTPSLHLPGARS